MNALILQSYIVVSDYRNSTDEFLVVLTLSNRCGPCGSSLLLNYATLKMSWSIDCRGQRSA